MKIMDNIGERIKKCRSELKISQAALAEHVGVSRVSVTQWESSTTTPNELSTIKLAGAFKRSVGWLKTGEEDSTETASALEIKYATPIADFRKLQEAFSDSNAPEILNDIFAKALEFYLQDSENQDTFSDYMVDLLTEKMGKPMPRELMRQIISDTVQERNTDARMLREPGIDTEPDVDHIVNDIIAELEAKHGKLNGEALEKKREAIRKDVLSAIVNGDNGSNGGVSSGEGSDAPRTQTDHG